MPKDFGIQEAEKGKKGDLKLYDLRLFEIYSFIIVENTFIKTVIKTIFSKLNAYLCCRRPHFPVQQHFKNQKHDNLEMDFENESDEFTSYNNGTNAFLIRNKTFQKNLLIIICSQVYKFIHVVTPLYCMFS